MKNLDTSVVGGLNTSLHMMTKKDFTHTSPREATELLNIEIEALKEKIKWKDAEIRGLRRGLGNSETFDEFINRTTNGKGFVYENK